MYHLNTFNVKAYVYQELENISLYVHACSCGCADACVPMDMHMGVEARK